MTAQQNEKNTHMSMQGACPQSRELQAWREARICDMMTVPGCSRDLAAFMVDVLIARREKLTAAGHGDVDAELRRWGEKTFSLLDRWDELDERRTALADAARARIQDFVDRVKAEGGNVADALELLLLGRGKGIPGSPESVSRQGASLRALWGGSLASDLESAGVLPLLRGDKGFPELVMREMVEPESTGDAAARQTAALFTGYLRDMAREINACGADIDSLENYVPQHHDSLRIRRVGEKTWVKHVARRIDPERTFPDLDAEEIPAALSGVYQAIVSGRRPEYRRANPFLPPEHPGRNERRDCILYFNSAQSAVDYSRHFTSGGIGRAMLEVVEVHARRVALMRVFGPRPEAMITSFLDGLPVEDAGREHILNCYRSLAGESGPPENPTAARVAAESRGLESMVRLGCAFLSSFADIASKVTGACRSREWLEDWDDRVRGACKRFQEEERRELFRRLGRYSKALLGELYSTFDVNDALSGDMTRWMNAFYTICHLVNWNEPHRAAYAVCLSNQLARFVTDGGGDPVAHPAAALRRTGLLNRLDLLKKMVEEVNGEHYIFPESVSRLSDADLERHLPLRLRENTRKVPPPKWEAARSAGCSRLRDEVARALIDYYAGEIGCALSGSAVKNRISLYSLGRPGVVTAAMRDISRRIGGFPVSWEQWLGAVYPYSARSLLLNRTKRSAPGFIHFFAAATVIGFVSMLAESVVMGRQRPNWEKPIAPTLAAITRSGAFGVLGHFYLGMASRFNRQGAFSPPVTEALARMGELSARLARREFADGGDAAVHNALDHLPFVNLHYTRQAIDYLASFHVWEAVAPGTLNQSEKDMVKTFRDKYL